MPLSLSGNPVDLFYLRLAKEGTLVLLGPAAFPPGSILHGGPLKGR